MERMPVPLHSRQCHSQKLGSVGSKPHRVLLAVLCAALNIKGRESVNGESCVCVFSFISAAKWFPFF